MARIRPKPLYKGRTKGIGSSVNSSFGLQVHKFAKKTGMTLEEAHSGIIIALFSAVILDTPVDTGQARANWNTSATNPDTSVTQNTDADGTASISRISRNMGKIGGVTWLSNSLPYIQRLEYEAWSAQAPEGMVRRNVARINNIVKRVASEVRK